MCQRSVSLAAVKPIPIESDKAAIVIFRCVKPALESISIPDTMMVPNIMTVHPPRTDSGREAKKLPIGGKRPARIMQPAPVAIVKRLTTLVMLIRPTFCEKDVTGGHPNSAEIAEANPSQANEPDISSDLISRPNPPDTMAVVSPIVSAAETMKIIATEKMAPMLNSGV